MGQFMSEQARLIKNGYPLHRLAIYRRHADHISMKDRNTLIEKIVREEEVIKPFRLPYPVEAPLV
jgi:hypothetical protein